MRSTKVEDQRYLFVPYGAKAPGPRRCWMFCWTFLHPEALEGCKKVPDHEHPNTHEHA